MSVTVFVPDLMDRSKVLAAVPDAVVVARVEQLAPAVGDVVVIDLSRPGAIAAVAPLVATGARVIGFASHVDRDGLDAARAAGCAVYARSAFFSRLGELLASS
jgi:hypothetical protein